jgi:hypothetical protein
LDLSHRYTFQNRFIHQPSIYEFAICDFRYSFDADDYSHPYDVIVRKTRLRAINILFGGLVGAFNFGNILFYLKAHQAFADNPSTVFAAMNMGVIILGV